MRLSALMPIVLVLLTSCSDYNLRGGSERGGRDRDTGEDIPVDGPQPDVKVEPAQLSFGWKLVDCPADPQTVTVSNVGDLDLRVDSLRLTGTGSDAFNIDGAPETLAPGASFTFQVGFTARGFVEYDVVVEVESNDPDEPVSTVGLTGRGSESSMNEEMFVQPAVGSVDVLWVVDNSGSMSEIVNQLGDRFQSFLTSFDSLGIDYHVAAVSTDMDTAGQQGRFQGPTKVITSSDPDPVGLFIQATDLGSSGSGSEKGMDAAYAALTSPLIDGENAGFLRDDAVLAVVVISDEDDSSVISNGAFISWLDGIKGDRDRSSFSAVVGDYDGSSFGFGCSSSGFPPVTAEPGERYVKAQQATGGTFQSICDEDFDQVLAYLGYGASGLKFDFPLAKQPTSIGAIKVTVDGVEIPRHPINGWFYDSSTNSVKFSRSSVPGPEATVVITYPVQEDC